MCESIAKACTVFPSPISSAKIPFMPWSYKLSNQFIPFNWYCFKVPLKIVGWGRSSLASSDSFGVWLFASISAATLNPFVTLSWAARALEAFSMTWALTLSLKKEHWNSILVQCYTVVNWFHRKIFQETDYFSFFLSLRFYVKSLLTIQGVQKLPFQQFQRLWILSWQISDLKNCPKNQQNLLQCLKKCQNGNFRNFWNPKNWIHAKSLGKQISNISSHILREIKFGKFLDLKTCDIVVLLEALNFDFWGNASHICKC